MASDEVEHFCESADSFPADKFLQCGKNRGERVLIVGESPARNGWRRSGRAFYTPEGKLLPTGRNLNSTLEGFGLSVETCGFTELVKCYVGKHRSQLTSCGLRCWPIFERQIQNHSFDTVILLGVTTLQIWNKINESSLRIGELAECELVGRTVKLLPLYHPSPISPTNHRRNMEIVQEITLHNKLVFPDGSASRRPPIPRAETRR